MDAVYNYDLFDEDKSAKSLDASYGLNISGAELMPMNRFLRSDKVTLHPSESCKMPRFFKAFDAWCISHGYGKQPHQKYIDLWRQYSIRTGRGRMLYGVSVNDSSR